MHHIPTTMLYDFDWASIILQLVIFTELNLVKINISLIGLFRTAENASVSGPGNGSSVLGGWLDVHKVSSKQKRLVTTSFHCYQSRSMEATGDSVRIC